MPDTDEQLAARIASCADALDEAARSQGVAVERALKDAQVAYELPPSDVIGVGLAIVEFEGQSIRVQWSAHLPQPEVHFIFEVGRLSGDAAAQNELLRTMMEFNLEMAVVGGARFGLLGDGEGMGFLIPVPQAGLSGATVRHTLAAGTASASIGIQQLDPAACAASAFRA